jgi:hypothetical protein
MTAPAIDRELLDLENEYWQAIKERNVDAAMRLTDDSCIITGAQGASSVDRTMFESMLRSPQWTLQDFAISDPLVHRLTDDVAIVAYKIREHLLVDGKPITVEAADATTWVRRAGRWVSALHTESVAGDPFGRDKTQASATPGAEQSHRLRGTASDADFEDAEGDSCVATHRRDDAVSES